METTHAVILTIAFADATDRSFKFNGVDQEQFQYVADRVRAINANIPANFKTTFVSANGAEATMISKAQWIETTEEVIYNAG